MAHWVWLVGHALLCLFLLLSISWCWDMIDITTQISMTISLLVKAPMHVNDIYPFRVIQLQISSSSFPCDTRATQKQIPPPWIQRVTRKWPAECLLPLPPLVLHLFSRYTAPSNVAKNCSEAKSLDVCQLWIPHVCLIVPENIQSNVALWHLIQKTTNILYHSMM